MKRGSSADSKANQVTAVYIDLKATTKIDLHQKLIAAIYNYRLFTDIQLQALFQQAQQQNSTACQDDQLGADDISQVCMDVKKQFLQDQ